jgi:excisionase family DNA binding protein
VRRWGVSRQSIYQQLQRGTLPYGLDARGCYVLAGEDVRAYEALRATGQVRTAERCPGDMTLREVGEATGLAYPIIQRHIYGGELHAHRHGTRWCVCRADVERVFGR